MPKEKGNGKKLAGNQAGNRPSAEEEESSKQLGTANEAGNKRGRGRPPKQRSDKEEKIRHAKKIQRDRDDRAKKALDRLIFMHFCELPGINDMFDIFCKEFKGIIIGESLKSMAEPGSKLTEGLEQLDERTKSEFISKYQKLFEKFFAEEGTNEKFKAMWSKAKEEEDRKCQEKIDEILEEDQPATLDEKPEMLEANLRAGPSNIGSNSEGEWQSSTTTSMTGGVINSSSTGGRVGIGPILGTQCPSPILGTPCPSKAAELQRKREEEPREARRRTRSAMRARSAMVRYCECSRPPICGARPSAFMADAHYQISPESTTAPCFSTSKGETSGAAQLEERFKKLQLQVHKPFCEMPGINDMFKCFNEEFMKINEESLKSKFVRKWQELFKKLFEEEGTTEKFKAVCLKRDEPSGTAPPGDHNIANIAGNTPQLQIAKTGTNNVEQEDNIANQENEAAVAAHNTGMGAAAASGSWYP